MASATLQEPSIDAEYSAETYAADVGRILGGLVDGVAILDKSLVVLWCNPAFRSWTQANPVGRPIAETMPIAESLSAPAGLLSNARGGAAGSVRLPVARDRFLEFRASPATGDRLILELRDVSKEELRKQKLDVLQHAGRTLANLDAEHLAEMSLEERTELLKHNVRQFIHDMLHYDTIEIRLLNRRTGELEPLLEDGMTPEAARRTLYAHSDGQGVTGFVAATGKSYLCEETARDARFLEGAAGTRSSMTVPLLVGDEVIGTFNVESPVAQAFSAEDLQFTEIFAREIAQALYTLELLSAQKQFAASESYDAVSREIALPTDNIIAVATGLLQRVSPDAPAEATQLRQVLADARSIKKCMAQVGDTLTTAGLSESDAQAARRLQGLRVLVVDADDRVRRSAHSILDRRGCLVETARSGGDALAMAQAGQYDAVLVDIRLPDLSGYDAFRKLRDLQPTARMILMTAFGYDSSHSIVHARQEGLRWVLYKPFRTDQLIDALIGPPPPEIKARHLNHDSSR